MQAETKRRLFRSWKQATNISNAGVWATASAAIAVRPYFVLFTLISDPEKPSVPWIIQYHEWLLEMNIHPADVFKINADMSEPSL
jgi:hypothetical protein